MTKMTDLKTNANSTVIKTAQTIAQETKEEATKLLCEALRKNRESTQALNEILVGLHKKLESLGNGVLADLTAWSRQNINKDEEERVSVETEIKAVDAIYAGLKIVDAYKEKCLGAVYMAAMKGEN